MIYLVVTEIETEEGMPSILETTRAMHKRIFIVMTLKLFSLKSICQTPNQ